MGVRETGGREERSIPYFLQSIEVNVSPTQNKGKEK